jgi:anti-sigma factor RsiW
MNNDITIEERIDNYLLGRMSDEDKRLFEADLERDAELKEEFECQKQVANAVQKVAMRDFLVKHAEERQQENSTVINLSEVFSRISGKVRDYFSSSQRVVWTLASVAAMVVAVVGGFNYSSTLHSLENNGMLAYAELTVPVARDGNHLDELMARVYSLIGSGDFEKAQLSIDEARRMIEDSIPTEVSTEEEEYDRLVLQQKLYDIDWFEAIMLMKQGKILKAK